MMNAFTALFSSFAAGFLALSGKTIKYQAPILGAFVFAFTPVVYINSVNSMDYLWAVAFILGSLYFSLRGKITLAGLFLGLAIGTRLTSVAMLPAMLLVHRYQGSIRKDFVKFILTSFAIGGAFYIPALLTYGLDFITYHQAESIPIEISLTNATVGVWGWVGTGAILVLLSTLVWRRVHPTMLSTASQKSAYWHIWLIVIAIYLLLYMLLPHEAAYLIPLVPFSILFIQEFIPPKGLQAIAACVICSSLLIGVFQRPLIHAPGFDQRFKNLVVRVEFSRLDFVLVPFYGSLIYDHTYRRDEIERIENIIAFGNGLHEESLIIVGWNLAKFAKLGLSLNRNTEITHYTDYLDKVKLKDYLDKGFHIYYLPEMLPTSIEFYGIDLRDYGATEIDIN